MVEEEGPLLSQACLEGEGVYCQVHHEVALGLGDQSERELVITSHCPHPHYDLMGEVEGEALCVLKTGSFQEQAVFHLVGEGGVLSGRVAWLENGC